LIIISLEVKLIDKAGKIYSSFYYLLKENPQYLNVLKTIIQELEVKIIDKKGKIYSNYFQLLADHPQYLEAAEEKIKSELIK